MNKLVKEACAMSSEQMSKMQQGVIPTYVTWVLVMTCKPVLQDVFFK